MLPRGPSGSLGTARCPRPSSGRRRGPAASPSGARGRPLLPAGAGLLPSGPGRASAGRPGAAATLSFRPPLAVTGPCLPRAVLLEPGPVTASRSAAPPQHRGWGRGRSLAGAHRAFAFGRPLRPARGPGAASSPPGPGGAVRGEDRGGRGAPGAPPGAEPGAGAVPGTAAGAQSAGSPRQPPAPSRFVVRGAGPSTDGRRPRAPRRRLRASGCAWRTGSGGGKAPGGVSVARGRAPRGKAPRPPGTGLLEAVPGGAGARLAPRPPARGSRTGPGTGTKRRRQPHR